MGETENLEDVGYLQDIISYVFDEKKIVTYKWISNILSIHVNRAKQLLYTFIKHISKERLKDLKITYLVGGILPDNRGCRLQVVSEEDLEKVKDQFKIITSEHVYSVSLTNCLTDLHNLCIVDGVKDSKILRHGAVRCTKGVARTTQELASKRQEAQKSVDDEKKWPSSQPKQEEKHSSCCNEKKSSKAPGSISSMFSAQNSKGKVEDNAASKKSEEVPKGNASSPEKKASNAKKSAKSDKIPSNRLAAMFSAQSAKPKPIKRDEQVENESKKEKGTKNEKQETPRNSSSDAKTETVTKSVQEKTSKNKGSKLDSKKTKQKKRKASDNKEDKSKKRKRIVVMDDSESSSDDVFGSDEDCDEEEEEKSRLATPPDEEEEITEEPTKMAEPMEQEQEQEKEIANDNHRGRKRRLVDKTFQDEEGYIVTKKVYEFVSCSEDESEGEKENEKSIESKVENEKSIESKVEKKKSELSVNTRNDKQKSQKKTSQKKKSPEKKKQATLMNFFKRS